MASPSTGPRPVAPSPQLIPSTRPAESTSLSPSASYVNVVTAADLGSWIQYTVYLEQANKRLQQIAAGVLTENVTLNAKIATLNMENAALKAENAFVEKQNQDLGNELEAILERNKQEKEAIKEVPQKQPKERLVSQKQMEKIIDDREKLIREKDGTISGQQRRIFELEGTLSSQLRRIRELEKMTDDGPKQNIKLQESIPQLRAEINIYKKANKRLKKEIGTFGILTQAQAKEIYRLNEQFKSLQAQLSTSTQNGSIY